MPKSAKPRKKCRPKSKLTNPMAWLLEGFSPVEKQSEYMLKLRLVNANALDSLVRGIAVSKHINDLLAAHNMSVALVHLKLGEDYAHLLEPAYNAFMATIERYKSVGKFVCRGPEIAAIKDLMELHDAQLSACTLERFEEGINIANAKKIPLLFHYSVKELSNEH